MDRIYMNRIEGQRRIHVEIHENEVSDLLDDLKTDPEPFAATHVFLDVLRVAEETFSPVVAEGHGAAPRQDGRRPVTQPTDRPGIDDLTSDMLDQLYDDRDRYEAERDSIQRIHAALAEQARKHHARAEQAEATLDAVRDELAAIDRDVRGKSVVALAGIRHTSSRIRAVLDQHDQTTT
jgi:hypothetical protein